LIYWISPTTDSLSLLHASYGLTMKWNGELARFYISKQQEEREGIEE